MKQTYILAHPLARQRALDAVKAAPEGYCVTVAEPKRNLAQNAILHCIIQDIAQSHEWAGKKRDAEVWKRLLVAAWCRMRGESMEILPALDGHGVDIVPARTSALSKSECADLITYVQAWQAEHEVVA